MNYSSHSADAYVSFTDHASETIPGVRYRILRMSFARRLELVRRVRDFAQRIEFLEAGDDGRNRFESSLLGAEIERLYLEWGLQAVEGLIIDGDVASPALLLEKGPEALAHEIVSRIRAECHLSEDERKN